MQEGTDVRWKQRFANYCKALDRLNDAVTVIRKSIAYGTDVSDLLKEGLIQRFEYTHELAWNVMKDYAQYQGGAEIRGSRDAIRWALQNGLADDRAWMKSIEDRNLTSHDYDSSTAEAIMTKIIGTYLPLFNQLKKKMDIIASEEDSLCTD